MDYSMHLTRQLEIESVYYSMWKGIIYVCVGVNIITLKQAYILHLQ